MSEEGTTTQMLSRPNLQPEDASITSRLEDVLDGDSPDEEIGEEEVIKDAPKRKIIDDTSDEDDDEEGEIQEEDDEDISDEEGKEPETVAEYLGLNENQVLENEDGTVSIVTNVDGTIKNLTLTDVIKGYQVDQFNSRKGEKLKAERDSFETERSTAMETINTNIEASMLVLQQVEQQLVNEYDSINWANLRTEKPEEFNTLRADYADKARQLTTMKDQAMFEAKKAMESNAKDALEVQKTDAVKQHNLLLEAIPALVDTAVYKTRMSDAKKFMLDTYGVTEKEANQITDSRLIRLIFDAQQFHKGKKQVKKQEGGKKLPKFMKPGQRRSKTTEAVKSSKRKQNQLRKTGSTTDAANLLLDRM